MYALRFLLQLEQHATSGKVVVIKRVNVSIPRSVNTNTDFDIEQIAIPRPCGDGIMDLLEPDKALHPLQQTTTPSRSTAAERFSSFSASKILHLFDSGMVPSIAKKRTYQMGQDRSLPRASDFR